MRSVRARLTFLFVALTGLLFAVFCVGLYLWADSSLDRELEDNLATHLALSQERFLEEYEEFRRGVHPEIVTILEDYTRASETAVHVSREDGAVVFATEGFAPPSSEGRIAAEIGGVAFRGRATRFESSGGDRFRLVVAVSEAPLRQRLRQLRWFLVLAFPVVLGVAGVCGLLFVGRALSPVEEIRRRAERITRENLTERVPEPLSTGEFRDLARTFNEMLDRLDRAFQDLQSLAADAAHELRTPLANLRAEVETALQRPQTPSEYEGILVSVGEEVARMNRLVGDLLALARIETRRDVLSRERVSVDALLREARETWQPVASSRGIGIRVEGDEVAVVGDRAALRRVVTNLVENAIQYNREGGWVALSVKRVDGLARLEIADGGVGIPSAHISRLFRRFFRVDESRSRSSGGAGLGLAICKSFVEAQGGRIEVTSAPGIGSTFVVELPLWPGPSTDGSSAAGTDSTLPATAASG